MIYLTLKPFNSISVLKTKTLIIHDRTDTINKDTSYGTMPLVSMGSTFFHVVKKILGKKYWTCPGNSLRW